MIDSILFRTYIDVVAPLFVLSLIFYLLERLAPAERNQSPAKRFFNLVYMPLILALLLLLSPFFGLVYQLQQYVLIWVGGGGFLLKLIDQKLINQSDWVAQLLFALSFAIVWDLYQYWMHRLQHTLPFLWETHKFHHSDTALNSSTHARTHFLSHLLFFSSYLLVMMFMGSQTPHPIATFVLFKLWGFFNHMNVRLNLGLLTPIVSGPQWHRIHHSLQTKHYNKNFAAFFPFIDIFFGTYYSPRKGEYPASGLPNKEDAGDLWEATIAPFCAWYGMTVNQLRLWIK